MTRYIVPLGRILFSAIFILNFPGHFSKDTISYASNSGMPVAALMMPVLGLISLIGGLSILLGYKAKHGAWLIVIFLLPITFMLHNFWQTVDPMMVSVRQAMFLKNLALLGAALLITHFGSGPFSIDKKLHKH